MYRELFIMQAVAEVVLTQVHQDHQQQAQADQAAVQQVKLLHQQECQRQQQQTLAVAQVLLVDQEIHLMVVLAVQELLL
jgi:hypothetical protein